MLAMTKSEEAQIAVIQNEMKHFTLALDEIKASTKDLDARFGRIEDILKEARGGWRMLLMIGTFAAAIGAVSTKIVAWLISFPFPR